MGDSKNVLIERDSGIAVVTINRPEKRNSMTSEAWEELGEVFRELDRDEVVRVVIVTGAGERSFVAGADIEALHRRTPLENLAGQIHRVLGQIEGMPKPVIAAIRGYALGGGCELAIACDMRIASEDAQLGQPEVRLGIIPGGGGTQRLVRLVGVGKAKELILTGDWVDAREAHRIGLVNMVVPNHQVMEKAREVAGRIMERGPVAVGLAKLAINVATNTDLGTGLAFERMAQAVAFGTEDKDEGTTAFLEKRPPHFEGR